MAKQAEASGAHAIELNMCCHNMSFNVAMTESARTEQIGASMGQNATAVSMIVEAVKQAVNIPVFVKITPEGGRIADVAKACYDKGADCVCSVANRLAIADFDIEQIDQGPYRLQDEPTLACFSGPWIKPLALRDVFEIRRKAGPHPFIQGTGGIASYQDAVQMIMCGADLIGVCTETMLKGFEFLPRWLKGLGDFMDRHGYRNYRDFRDLAVGKITSADKLTLHGGYAEVDLEKCKECGLCAAIGHCNAIIIVDKQCRIDRKKMPGLLHVRGCMSRRRPPHGGDRHVGEKIMKRLIKKGDPQRAGEIVLGQDAYLDALYGCFRLHNPKGDGFAPQREVELLARSGKKVGVTVPSAMKVDLPADRKVVNTDMFRLEEIGRHGDSMHLLTMRAG
ncbi:MAG: tRNA-dihydrouridine synthase [Kiritimatiellae bacterium]|nr:tRNA-dihydrouridine synthase [Kiritimatiellia bacterium]